MKNKPKIIRIFTYLCLIGYICLAVFLIYQATLDGEASSQTSNTVGDEINDIIDDGQDKTKLVKPTNLIITNPISMIHVGDDYKLDVDILPVNSSYKSLVYTSSDESVASINSDGKVEFHQKGSVVLKVSIKGFETISSEVSVLVNEIPLDDFSYIILYDEKEVISENDIYLLKQYNTYEIDFEFEPKNSTNTNVTYEYDKKYLSVYNGVINVNESTQSPIDLVIKVGDCSKTIKIKIEETIVEYISATGFDISKEKIELVVGNKVKLSNNLFGVSFKPEDATNKIIKYDVVDTNIAMIKSNTLVALKPGSTQVKLFNEESNTEHIVEVVIKNMVAFENEKPYDIKQDYLSYDKDKNIYKIRNGISGKITVNFTENSTYKIVKYNSLDSEVLIVGDDGTITPIKIGKAKVIIEIDDGFDQKYTFEVDIEVERTPLIENMQKFYYTIRKSIGHFAAFFVLGMLGALAFSIIFDKKKWLFSIPMNFILGFMIAGLTELIQKYVPGRYGCWDDVWLDYSGYISASVIFTGVVLLIYLLVSARQHKNIE